MPTAFITGTNRGIGLALVKQFLDKNWQVYATCRNPTTSDDLQALSDNPLLSIHTLDVLDDNSIKTLQKSLADRPIDLLINNAGILGDEQHSSFGDMNYASWMELFQVNTMAPMKLLEAFIVNLKASEHKHVVSISSAMASIANQEGHMMAYSTSKTALNSVMKTLSVTLKNQGIRVNMLSPGWVQTDMGGPDAMISTELSAELLFNNIMNIKADGTGLFIGHEGDIYPW